MTSKRYGLQLTAKPAPKAQKPVVPSLFNDHDDEESIERELAREAAKQRSIRQAEEQQRKALEQDPNVFDYDGVYDEMKQKEARPFQKQREVKRESRYIPGLIEKAKRREREHDIIYERQLAKERAKEDHLYSDKEKFVTSAYKKKLAEQNKWLEEERIRELKEQQEEVTKRKDLSDFYRNLSRNVAFGGGGGGSGGGVGAESPEGEPARASLTSSLPMPANDKDTNRVASPPGASTSLQVKQDVQDEAKVRDQTDGDNKQEHAKGVTQTDGEKEDEIRAREETKRQREESARERYLARKKLKAAQ